MSDSVMQHRAGLCTERGFSIVELMIAVAIALLMIAAVSGVVLSSKQSYRSSEGLSQVNESGRSALSFLERAIRGTGVIACGNTQQVANVLNNPSAQWWSNWAAIRGFSGDAATSAAAFGSGVGQRIAGTHAIQLQGMGDSAYSIESHNGGSANIKLAGSGHDIVAGDILMVCDSDHATIFQVSNINGTGNLVHNKGSGTSPGNCSNDLAFPTDCGSGPTSKYEFAPNSTVAKLAASTWYIGNNGRSQDGGRSLYRVGIDGTPIEMAAGVVDLQISYRIPSSTSWVDASSLSNTQWDQVNAVTLTLSLQSAEKNIATAASTPNGRLTREITQVISLRNRTL
ncbi:prepilin-type N-terminal cleavage/methylation domain-containing protein [uncultured Deefgea sp.]|uniref:prepilin-type N-terminal cleavage/methylation domain-containing protein n=1 Tax=uncultured Deefgea sp. TaxID=1304914 RepID=UPI002599C581|nr:prepilin-type N-terminal cleavage/methylation domain-containing protein [uncultured Deefgea sp.]